MTLKISWENDSHQLVGGHTDAKSNTVGYYTTRSLAAQCHYYDREDGKMMMDAVKKRIKGKRDHIPVGGRILFVSLSPHHQFCSPCL